MVNVLTNILKNDRLDVYPLFKKFCSLKEKGLRKESFKSLSSFIEVHGEYLLMFQIKQTANKQNSVVHYHPTSLLHQ